MLPAYADLCYARLHAGMFAAQATKQACGRTQLCMHVRYAVVLPPSDHLHSSVAFVLITRAVACFSSAIAPVAAVSEGNGTTAETIHMVIWSTWAHANV